MSRRPIKRGSWSPSETARLHAIPDGPRRQKSLKTFSKHTGREYASVYAKWNAEVLHGKGDTAPVRDGGVILFQIDTTLKSPGRNNTAAFAMMQDNLKKVIPTLKPNAGNVPVPSKNEAFVRKFLNATFPSLKFVVSRSRKEPTIARIFRTK